MSRTDLELCSYLYRRKQLKPTIGLGKIYSIENEVLHWFLLQLIDEEKLNFRFSEMYVQKHLILRGSARIFMKQDQVGTNFNSLNGNSGGVVP